MYTPPKTNMRMENPPWMKMYFLLNMGNLPACHVSCQGVYIWQEHVIQIPPLPLTFFADLFDSQVTQVTLCEILRVNFPQILDESVH